MSAPSLEGSRQALSVGFELKKFVKYLEVPIWNFWIYQSLEGKKEAVITGLSILAQILGEGSDKTERKMLVSCSCVLQPIIGDLLFI